MSLKYSVTPVSEIDPGLQKSMFKLFGQYYADVDFERFVSDLHEKTSVILLWDKSKPAEDSLFGFSTVLIKKLSQGGRLIYSGDTVVDSEYWGSRILQSGFSRILFLTRLRHPFSPLYWMLISKGFKTYMLMRRNFDHSFPKVGTETPANLAVIKDEFYSGKFGDSYDPKTSIIDFGKSLGRVKGQLAEPTEKDMRNPEVLFFLKKNPRFYEGVELACIANIRWSDIAGILLKYVPFLRPRASGGIAEASPKSV